MLHVCVKSEDENHPIVKELECSSAEGLLSYWKQTKDMTPHYLYYKTDGKEGSPFPDVKAIVVQSDGKGETKNKLQKETTEYSEVYTDDTNDAMLNRMDPKYALCMYFHDANSCNVWEKQTKQQWKHKGFVNAPDSEDDDDGDDDDDGSDDGSDDDDIDSGSDNSGSASESASDSGSASASELEKESESDGESETEVEAEAETEVETKVPETHNDDEDNAAETKIPSRAKAKRKSQDAQHDETTATKKQKKSAD